MTTMHPDLATRLIKGVGWTGFGQFARLATAGAALIVISRFVSPDQVGLAAMALIVLGVSNSIASLGPAQALVQRSEITDAHATAAFQLTMLIGCSLAIIIFLGADVIASLFHDPHVAFVLRVGAFGVPLTVLPASQMALLQRSMRFREYALVTAGGGALAAMSAIALAIAGLGIWAVLAGQLLVGGFSFLLVQFYVPWHGSFRLRVQEMKELFAFGANTSLNVITGYVAQNLPNFFVGRFLNAERLGFYSISFRANELSYKQLQTAFTSTMLPALATFQSAPDRLRALFVQSTRMGILFTAPPLLIFTVASAPLVKILWGDKWLPAADILWRLSMAQMILAIGTNVSPVFQAIGRPQYGWIWNVGCSVVFIPSYFYAVRYGTTGVATALLIMSPFMAGIQLLWLQRVLALTGRDIWKMLALPFLALTSSSVAALAVEAFLQAAGGSPTLVLTGTIVAGACVYCPIVYFANPNLHAYIRRIAVDRLSNSRAN